MATPTLDRETILHLVETWPIGEQVALADAILASAHAAPLSPSQPPAVPSATLRGIFANGQPAPSDEEVARILEEERLKKYGA